MITTAKIVDYDGDCLTIRPDGHIDTELLKKSVNKVEIRLVDCRTITAEQRKKAYALIKDICQWSGHLPEEVKEYSKLNYCAQHGIDWFSLSDCDKTTAREYITYLVEFCMMNDVPCKDRLIDQTDDIGVYLYQCLKHRKCAICGKKADFHHCEGFRPGMGVDRDEVLSLGIMGMALCREHHGECHFIGEETFEKKYHVYGTKITEELCDILKLRR